MRVNTSALHQVDAVGGTDEISLNLFDDVQLRARRHQLESTSSGGWVWKGRLLDVEGQATFAIHDGVVAGTVFAGTRVFEILHAGADEHEVSELEPSEFPTDDPHVNATPLEPDPQAEAMDAAVAAEMAGDSSSQVDVMVIWTPAARTAAGGTSAIQSLIDLAVANTNTAYANSAVTQRLRLVYAGELDHTEGAPTTDLSRLAATADGYLDSVHALRNTYGADVVTLLGNGYVNAGACGVGYLMTTVSTGFASSAFNVVDRTCAAGNLSYAHELGHNMGLQHDPNNATSSPAYSYAYGYQQPSGAFRTVMAYACPTGSCPRVLHFANPAVTFSGMTTGTASQNTALALNNTAPSVANFRQAVSGSCLYSLGSTSTSVGSGTATSSVGVTAGTGCAWSATSNASWLTITSGASGSGNGTTGFSVVANTAGTARVGTLTVAGQTFTVNQAAAACGAFTISPTSQSNVAAGGASLSVTVTGTTGCARTATSNASWITVTAGASGTGGGTVSLSVAANTVGTSRTGTVTIGGQIFGVTQAAASCGAFSLSPASVSVGAAGGPASTTVTGTSGCARTATSNASWITVTGGASGSGSGTVTLSVAANTVGTSRTGTVSVGGQTFTVTQAPAACNYTVSPLTQSAASAGGSFTTSVSAATGCGWAATSNAPWITLSNGASGSGNGSASFNVAGNSSTTSRVGSVTVAGRVVSVTQAGSTPVTVTALTSNVSLPTTVGTTITWTATATGGSSPLLYQFWRFSQSTGAWTMVRDYATSASYTWATTSANAGTHALQVWVKASNSSAQKDAYASTGYFSLTSTTPPPSSGPLTATASLPSPRIAGTPFTWTINTSGGVAPLQIKFWVYSSVTGAWTVARDYGTGNQLTYTPPVAGTYALQAWVRNAGSTANYNVIVASGFFTVQTGSSSAGSTAPTGTAPTGVLLTTDRPAPFIAGVAVTLTATPTGTTEPVEHKFWEYADGTWRVLREYASGQTVTWQPTAGQRALQVWTRRVGSPLDKEVYAASGFVTVLAP